MAALCWATTSAGFIWSMFMDASIFAMKSSPELLGAGLDAGFTVAGTTGAATTGGAGGGTTAVADGTRATALAAGAGAEGSSSEGLRMKEPRLAGAGDAFTGVSSAGVAAVPEEEELEEPAMRIEPWRDMGEGAAAEGDMPEMELLRAMGEGMLMLAERRSGEAPPKLIGGPSFELKDLRCCDALSGLPLGVPPLLLMLFERSSVWNEVGSSKAGAFIALVCDECRRLITLSISAWERRFTEDARSSLGSIELERSLKVSERGVAERRSYRLACSASVSTSELRVRWGLWLITLASSMPFTLPLRTIGDLAMVVCALRREKMSSPLTLPPPPGEVKLRVLIMLFDASGICGVNEWRRTSSSLRSDSIRSFSMRFASASAFSLSCTGSASLKWVT